MDYRVRYITRLVKRLDCDLYAGRDNQGKIHIYRRKVIVNEYEFNKLKFGVLDYIPTHIMSLTADWTPKTAAVDWGSDLIIQKLQSIDSHNKNLEAELLKQEEQRQKKENYNLKTKTEDALRQAHDGIKKTFRDVNTALMKSEFKRKET